MMESRKKAFKDALIEIKIRVDRGNSLIYWGRNLVLIVAAIKYLFDLTIPMLILSSVGVIIAFYIIGWLDLNYFKINQREMELITGKYNNYFKKLKKRKV